MFLLSQFNASLLDKSLFYLMSHSVYYIKYSVKKNLSIQLYKKIGQINKTNTTIATILQ